MTVDEKIHDLEMAVMSLQNQLNSAVDRIMRLERLVITTSAPAPEVAATEIGHPPHAAGRQRRGSLREPRRMKRRLKRQFFAIIDRYDRHGICIDDIFDARSAAVECAREAVDHGFSEHDQLSVVRLVVEPASELVIRRTTDSSGEPGKDG